METNFTIVGIKAGSVVVLPGPGVDQKNMVVLTLSDGTGGAMSELHVHPDTDLAKLGAGDSVSLSYSTSAQKETSRETATEAGEVDEHGHPVGIGELPEVAQFEPGDSVTGARRQRMLDLPDGG